jgi:hypothetical protein
MLLDFSSDARFFRRIQQGLGLLSGINLELETLDLKI